MTPTTLARHPHAPRRRARAALVATLTAVLCTVLLSAGATVAQDDSSSAVGGAGQTQDSQRVVSAAAAVQGSGAKAASVATVTRSIVTAAAPAGRASLGESQLHQQRAAQLQSMLQTMLQLQPSAPVTAEVDPRIGLASCSLLGRTWSAAGCSRQSCITGHEYAKTGANAETCRIGGRRGASYGVEIDFRRCEALHRTWIIVLNYCASDPHRTESAIARAPQCLPPYTSYVVMSETEGSYDECMRPGRVAELQRTADASGQPLAQVAALRSRTQCAWSPQHVFVDGVCVAGPAPGPAVTRNVAVIGDSITWRGTNELATLRPDWVIDGSSGRQVDALDDRLGAYRAAHGDPGGVVFALGTNGRSGFTEEQFRAAFDAVPAGVPVLLVTPYREAATTGRPELVDEYAAWMHRLAVDRPLTCVADWRAAVKADPALLVDGVHPTSIGEVSWAELIDRSWSSCLGAHSLTSS